MARVYVEVFGCSANVADSEIASGLLREAGHTVVASPEDADASIVLTCIVKTPTELRVVRRLRELSSLARPLIVAGCMPKAERELVEEIAPGASLMGPDDLHRVVEVVEAAIGGRRLEALQGGRSERTCLPRVRRNPLIHIAPIASGCLGDCSYCIVKQARGRLNSFPADEIVEDARRALEQGCKEIWVTAEDTAAYRWRGERLPQLLEALSALDGRFYIRVGMMTPNQALPVLDELTEAYRSEKVFKFLHVPVQSGSDEVLRRMRRRYTVDDFRCIVDRFRAAFPDLSLSTDIICGFPGETEEQFGASMRLVEEVQPDVLNISRFWPRPGTEAAEMEGQLHGRETKRRSRRLTRLWRRLSLERCLRWVGWRGKVLVDELGRGGTLVGRNYAYKPVVLRGAALGAFVEVRVTEARAGYLLGRTV
ncbi:2-methylthioadenine synthetase [Candidatus Bathyarchaeota archaeon]|nr:MAG: 2-methylthioadenine synthetase [Candidatus Bathyarchaeota archaeon]